MSDLINHSLHLHNLLSRLVGKTPNVKRKKTHKRFAPLCIGESTS